MTPLPKRRHSTRRGGKRKASIRQKLTGLVPCKNCSSMIRPHRICPNCGFYNGKEILKPKTPKAKK
ncbi:50S ribosomal protein L32 [Candidatus Gottesmanbacteria bacterium RBG_16_52_11]|uniref:Large ribosomal subunit protein bL32 n=1 Tax=Candidatus Gottesmanbacteria bacterium RBG_16_52_11 TaxID=1798374 RepID=A0A1F5YNQ4_9BACT|nr:MAG: 50S ribosomal protein L32 [Candidatus Gottesmanbacteria bacterium RBG_16_52_11]